MSKDDNLLNKNYDPADFILNESEEYSPADFMLHDENSYEDKILDLESRVVALEKAVKLKGGRKTRKGKQSKNKKRKSLKNKKRKGKI
jgi:hypothetical protein